MKMETLCSSETLVNIYQSEGCHISEDSTLPSHRWKNLSSNKYIELAVSKELMFILIYVKNIYCVDSK
jgi:hypothetical protein